ncbi:HDOD domain-containing protein [Spirochaeta thermophila]|uniref:HD domain protein n=1 Tax=Winmispira thermophila (strain ATCC 49972 / DSM 6192 / RI 19.B1) TaxID=665571 RepID=E0RNE2_WINT6|nr:HDOD domain-containing protein [Spirochaeta thermophila]ADN01142.1 HD domain protein [Spirochaeta thermophila DSM 6192]
MKKAVVDNSKVLQAIRHNLPVTIKIHAMTPEIEERVEEILDLVLTDIGREKMRDALLYCLKELVANAQKANAKRAFFHERGLDIEDEEEYEEGMRVFHEVLSEDPRHYFELLKELGLYTRITFQLKNDILYLIVANNSPLLKEEQIRIFDRVARARLFETLEEALSTAYDVTEGAGLGIVTLIMILKRLGLSEEAFDIDVVGEETVARLTIPMDRIHLSRLTELTERVVDEIESLPQFPENVLYLQKLIDDPNSTVQDIARQISTDPSLTADLLKVVNSAQFMLPKKVDSILEGVKILGLRGLKNLLYTYGTQKILGLGTEEQQHLWDHSLRTAYYAYNLAQTVFRDKELMEDVYVGGILHDMGKIVFSRVHPTLLEKIEMLRRERDIPQNLLEELYGGLHHAEIGALLAEKWNFPDLLVAAIRFHHTPEGAPGEMDRIVQTVYAANAIAMFEEGRLTWEQMDHGILSRFQITDKEGLDQLRRSLRRSFEREMKRRS